MYEHPGSNAKGACPVDENEVDVLGQKAIDELGRGHEGSYRHDRRSHRVGPVRHQFEVFVAAFGWRHDLAPWRQSSALLTGTAHHTHDDNFVNITRIGLVWDRLELPVFSVSSSEIFSLGNFM
jgi:hypothetical protein